MKIHVKSGPQIEASATSSKLKESLKDILPNDRLDQGVALCRWVLGENFKYRDDLTNYRWPSHTRRATRDAYYRAVGMSWYDLWRLTVNDAISFRTKGLTQSWTPNIISAAEFMVETRTGGLPVMIRTTQLEQVVVNVEDALKWLISDTDKKILTSNKRIKNTWSNILMYAEGEQEVITFSKPIQLTLKDIVQFGDIEGSPTIEDIRSLANKGGFDTEDWFDWSESEAKRKLS